MRTVATRAPSDQHPPRPLDPVTRWLVLGLPVAFLAHDLGEVRGNEELNQALADLASGSPRLARVAERMRTSDRQMAVAVSALTAACVVVAWRAARRPAPSPAMSDFAVGTAVVGGHLVSHVAQSVLLRRPAPGLAGGLLVTVPYTVVVLRRLQQRGYVDGRQTARWTAAGFVLLGPVLAAVRLLARRLA